MAIKDPATKLANKIGEIVESKVRKRTKKTPLIKIGKVQRIDQDGMPWISIAGSDRETPVNGTVLSSVKIGDVVSVNIENGKCNLLGNADDPSVGALGAKNVSNQEIQNAVDQNGAIGRAIDVESNKTIGKVDGMISDKADEIEETIYELDLKTGEEVRILNGRTSSSLAASDAASFAARVANQAADEAREVAEATGQHFWEDTNGAHVTEVTREEWEDSSGGSYQSGHNILVNSLGILLRRALNYLAAWTGSALAFYDGNGNAADNVTASFGSSGAQIGKVDKSHLELDYHSLRLIDKEGNEYFEVEDLRDSSGTGEIVNTFTGDGSTQTFYLSPHAYDTSYTVSVSDSSGGTPFNHTDRVYFSSAPTDGAIITVAYRSSSYGLKAYTVGIRASGSMVGIMSYAEGSHNTASGNMSHAEGNLSVASGRVSHAEGLSTTASGHSSHAEGWKSIASGDDAHAEGGWTEASGDYSHAQNYRTVAEGRAQTVLGTYNVADSTSAVIVGNGTGTGATPHSNAMTLDWDGNAELAGGLSLFGGTALEDMFLCVQVSATIGAVAASGTKTLDIAAARTGYKPIAISGFYISGAAQLNVYMLRLSGTNAQIYLRNGTSSATSASATAYVQVLYIKTA